MAVGTILSMLSDIGAVDPRRVRQFAERTRDRAIPVLHDPASGVIFIDNFYVGDEEYREGAYRQGASTSGLEDWLDTKRRVHDLSQFYVGRSVIDIGCGQGSFLKSIQGAADSVFGVELQDSYRAELAQAGIDSCASIAACDRAEAVFMFHVVEHLHEPLQFLALVRERVLASSGCLVVEVPHARDFLISRVASVGFLESTLWSQHLILHTRESLTLLLKAAGYSSVEVRDVQRYSLANHLTWLMTGMPGGHRQPISLMESPSLTAEYAAALSRIDACDTLIAVARP